MKSLKKCFSFGSPMEDKTATLSDLNANMTPIVLDHPFLNGCKNRPNDRDEEMDQLRLWLKKQPHLPILSDNHLCLFLHSNFYNVEATQETIEVYYSLRTNSPELFKDKGIFGPAVSNVWNVTNMVSLPGTTAEGYKVLLYRLIDYDASKLTFNDALKTFFLFNDIQLSEDSLSLGYIVIFDMKGISLSHLARCNISSIRKFMNYIQEGHPARLKGVHVINSVSFMDRVLALVRPLMKSGLIKLLSIHGSDLSNLFQVVPREMFPVEYGGPAESIQKMHDVQRGMAEKKYVKWVEEEELFLMDMSKRPKQNKKSCFIASSFKSLTID